jgi:hypothetical protein
VIAGLQQAGFGVHGAIARRKTMRGMGPWTGLVASVPSVKLRLDLGGQQWQHVESRPAVEKYLGMPSCREAQQYVKKVLKAYGKDTHPPLKPVVEPSSVIAAGERDQ